MRVYREMHADEIVAWRKSNVNRKFGEVWGGAKKRGLAFELDGHMCEAMFFGTCKYCGHDGEPGDMLGIDRNNDTASNSVPCCWPCNRMKACLDPVTFLERAMHIATCHGDVDYGLVKHKLANDRQLEKQRGKASHTPSKRGTRGVDDDGK